MTEDIKIALNEQDFRCLVRGGELTIEDASVRIKLIVNDIGWDPIRQALGDAMSGKDLYVPYTRSNEWRTRLETCHCFR